MGENSHPSETVLAAFAVGKLAENQNAIVEQHISACRRCAAVVAVSPRDDFVDRLLAAEHSHQPDNGPSRKVPMLAARGAPPETNLDRLPPELREHPRYEVLRLVAEGGLSWVYLARHRVTHNPVALKTIKPELTGSKELILRFLREARVAGQLSHANIARVFDAEHCGGCAFLVMEYVPGQTLAQLIAGQGPLTVSDACRFAREVALGLEHATAHGVVHRDIKPRNVMIRSADGTLRILDFGLGRIVDEQWARSRLTRENQVLGTPEYMAPEQAKDSRVADVRSDIYSLGCTLYFMLSGRPPFQAGSLLELVAKHASETPPSVTTLRSDVPREVATLLDRMLSKQPGQRPQSPREVAEILRAHAIPRHVEPQAAAAAGDRLSQGGALDRFRDTLAAAMLTPAVVLPLLTALLCLIVFLVA